MKKITFAAIIIAASLITFASCKWFYDSPKNKFTIVGKWKIDSVSTAKKDSDSATPLFIAFINSIKDSVTLQFNTDSSLQVSFDKKVNAYYLKDSLLFIKEDSLFIPYIWHYVNDSNITIFSKDSTNVQLRKQ